MQKHLFFVLEAGADDTNPGSYLRSAPVGAKPRSPGPCAVFAPLRSAQDQGPPDLVRPLTHVIGKNQRFGEHISLGKRNYDNSTAFYTEYFGENPKLLVDCIKKYHKHNGSHNKDEHYLDELLK